MYDIHVMLPDNPGSLGQFGLLMGRAIKFGHPPDGK
jgi:hypothetical protein